MGLRREKESEKMEPAVDLTPVGSPIPGEGCSDGLDAR